MKPEAQRIAIAEACGWTLELTENFKVLYPPGLKHYGFCCGKHLSNQEVWEAGLTGTEFGDYRFPDYTSDLNAMHEAIVWAVKNIPKFSQRFHSACSSIAVREQKYIWEFEAHHLSEPFLKTIGKWSE